MRAAAPFSLIALVACGIENITHLRSETDVFAQAPNNEVDILWVVDDSYSMAEEQATLAAGFASFGDELEISGTDFHIGVITTSFEYTNPLRGALQGDPPFLTFADDFETEFQERATAVGVEGSDKEKGLEAASWAVSPAMTAPNGVNAGFIRSTAQLLIVVVSDEEDCSDNGALEGQSPEACYTEDDQLIPVIEIVEELQDLKEDPSRVTVSAIVGQFDPQCPEVWHGSRYITAAQLTGGYNGDICEANWNGMLAQMGLHAVGIRDAFKLDLGAQMDTIEVLVNDGTVVKSETDGWTYDPRTWYVTFHGAAVPPRDAVITITYVVDPGNVAPVTTGT
jgi:hypothetical protein